MWGCADVGRWRIFYIPLSPYLHILTSLLLLACSPQEQLYIEKPAQKASFSETAFTASDETKLPVRRWLPRKKPRAVIVALHGMNDYSNAFATVGPYFAARGIALYAYDQRGFGASPAPGIWAGQENLRRDLSEFVHVIAEHHRRTPIYLLGESMGGAVAVLAASSSPSSLEGEGGVGGEAHSDQASVTPPPNLPAQGGEEIAGVILSAPALWGSDTLNPLYRGSLWLLAHTMPDRTFDGSDLKILASNNIPMLRKLAADPLVLKQARADAILGLVRLMDGAYETLPNINKPVLLLYGGKDQVIPPYPIEVAISRFETPIIFAYYPEGYHMLLRDLQGELVMKDIISWIENPHKALPSGKARLVNENSKLLF